MPKATERKRVRIGRACDQCNSRRIKCDGQRNCAACISVDINCTNERPRQAKGPKPKARIEQSSSSIVTDGQSIRFNYDLTSSSSSSSESHSTISPVPAQTSDSSSLSMSVFDFDLPGQQPTHALQSICELLSTERLPAALLPALPQASPQLGDAFLTPYLLPNSNVTSLVPRGLKSPAADFTVMNLRMADLILPRLATFFDRFHPKFSVFSPSEIYKRMLTGEHLTSAAFAAFLCAAAASSTIQPLDGDVFQYELEDRREQCRLLLDESCRLRSSWRFGEESDLDAVLTSMLISACLEEMGEEHASMGRLREALHLGERFRASTDKQMTVFDREECIRRQRMLNYLRNTERTYALHRSSGTLLFPDYCLSPSEENSDQLFLGPESLPPEGSLPFQTKLMSYIDSDVASCWAGRCNVEKRCPSTARRVAIILEELRKPPSIIFGADLSVADLSEGQKADLIVTRHWLRNRLLHLARSHPTSETDDPAVVSQNVVQVAYDTLESCREMSLQALDQHGIGFSRKLYDIACDLPAIASGKTPSAGLTSVTAKMVCEQLCVFVSRHKRASGDYAERLVKALVPLNCLTK